jgi:hypothetical protein
MKKEIKMTDEDFQWWTKFRETKKRYLTKDEYRKVCEIHARIKDKDLVYVGTCCSEIIQALIDDINEFYLKNE